MLAGQDAASWAKIEYSKMKESLASRLLVFRSVLNRICCLANRGKSSVKSVFHSAGLRFPLCYDGVKIEPSSELRESKCNETFHLEHKMSLYCGDWNIGLVQHSKTKYLGPLGVDKPVLK